MAPAHLLVRGLVLQLVPVLGCHPAQLLLLPLQVLWCLLALPWPQSKSGRDHLLQVLGVGLGVLVRVVVL